MIKIEETYLLKLIHWARRYCDGRATFAPSSFNGVYKEPKRVLNGYAKRGVMKDES